MLAVFIIVSAVVVIIITVTDAALFVKSECVCEGGKTKTFKMAWRNDKNGDITNFVFKIEKGIMLKKTCYTLEGGRIPKSKWSRLDNEKYVGT